MQAPSPKQSRIARIKKNLRQAMSLAWAASPRLLVRYTILGMINAIMPPVSVYLGSVLVNKIAQAQVKALKFESVRTAQPRR